MQVKIFESSTSLADIENQIAKWTEDLNPEIINVTMDIKPMHDYNRNRDELVLNQQWEVYFASVIYTK